MIRMTRTFTSLPMCQIDNKSLSMIYFWGIGFVIFCLIFDLFNVSPWFISCLQDKMLPGCIPNLERWVWALLSSSSLQQLKNHSSNQCRKRKRQAHVPLTRDNDYSISTHIQTRIRPTNLSWNKLYNTFNIHHSPLIFLSGFMGLLIFARISTHLNNTNQQHLWFICLKF